MVVKVWNECSGGRSAHVHKVLTFQLATFVSLLPIFIWKGWGTPSPSLAKIDIQIHGRK